MTNGIRKVWKGVEIFNQRILDSCKFITDSSSEYGLVYYYLFLAVSNVNRYHSAWCTTYQDSTLYVSIFLVSGKREGEEKHRETLLLCTIIFFFSKWGVLPCFISHRVIFSRKKNWRELYKNLTVLSSFDAYT